MWIALFGIQESLESGQESWNQARNLGILPRFQKIPNHVEENSSISLREDIHPVTLTGIVRDANVA